MKAFLPCPPARRNTRVPGRAAFTLAELLVAVTLFLMLLGGMLAAHLFGLRLSRTTEAKLETTRSARQILGRMTDEIRSCTGTWVGDVTNGDFVEILDGAPQTGSALLVQPTTNAADYIVYFLNTNDHTFRRTMSASGTASVLAQSVTNQTVFQAQDFTGQVLTNSQNNRVIHLTLEFLQPLPFAPGPDYYRLETSVTRRLLE
jgi:type II secretory pathway pseudopilin PulG